MKPLKILLSSLMAATLLLSAFGCAAPAGTQTEEPSAPVSEAPTAAPEATPEVTPEPAPAKPVLLAVSFGTSYDNLDASIGSVEAALTTAYPEYEVRRAFTSQIVIDIHAERGLDIDNVTEAMDKLVADGVKEVVIQPTHVMNGFEYDDVITEISAYADKFDSMKVGKALLTTDDDYTKLIASITTETAEYNNEDTAIVFMGHGTHHEENAVYSKLQKRLASAGYTNYFVGTVEAEPTLEQVMAAVQETDAKKVVLLPLMIVAGDHASNDMAGDEEDTWKTAFANAGYEVECVLKGLGEYAGVQEMIVEHAAATIAAKPVLLAVSFGTSYNENRDLSIGGVEAALQAANPEYEVRRAFTSQIVIDVLAERDGYDIDNVTEAMDRLVADGVKEVVIQPTHVMNGFEYDDVMNEISAYADKFDSMKVGKAILTTDDDYAKLIASLTEETVSYNAEDTAVVYMGHGTHHEENAVYSTLQQKLVDAGYTNYFVGTVEAEPTLEQVMELVKESGAKKVVLLPLMIVAGDHASNDMAGDEDGTWKVEFENAGYEVECVLKGLGEYAGVQKLIVEHAAAAK